MANPAATLVLTEQAVKNVFLENRGRIKNTELISKFQEFIKDPIRKDENRKEFKRIVNKLAKIQKDRSGKMDNDKTLVLKDKYMDEAGLSRTPDADGLQHSILQALGAASHHENDDQNDTSNQTVLDEDLEDQNPPTEEEHISIEQQQPCINVHTDESEEKNEQAEVSYQDTASTTVGDCLREGVSDNEKAQQFATEPSPMEQSVADVSEAETTDVKPQPSTSEKSISAIAQPVDATISNSTQDIKVEQQPSSPQFKSPETPSTKTQEATSKPTPLNPILPSASNQKTKSTATDEKQDKDSDKDSTSVSSASISDADRRWMLAAASCNSESIQRLLRENPDVAKLADFTNGYTALHWAAKKGAIDLIRLLVEKYNSDINATTHGGYTPLHLAVMHGRHDAVYLLGNRGYKADETIRDHSGRLAVHYEGNAHNTKLITARDLYELSKENSVAARTSSPSGAYNVRQSWSSNSLVSPVSRQSADSGNFTRIGSFTRASTSAIGRLFKRHSWGSSDCLAEESQSRERVTHSASPGACEERALMPPPSVPVRFRSSKKF